MTDLPSPVPPDALRARRDRLLDAAGQAGFGTVLATRAEHVRYLTATDGPGPRALVIGPDGTRLVAPDHSEDGEVLAGQGIDVVPFPAYSPDRLVDPAVGFEDVLGRVVALAVPTKIGCDTPSVPRSPGDPHRPEIADAAAVFANARRPRDRWEIAEIRARVAIVEAGLRAARSAAVTGASELQVAVAAVHGIARELGEMPTFDHNIGSGPRSALSDPHASPRVIGDGDLLLVDLYPPLRGYFADLTRTWLIGPTPTEAARLHEAVVAALRSGERLLGPGVPVAAIDRAVRASLRASGGLDASMGHHTGHGLGIFAWEHPWIGSGSAETLMAGDIIALEPGSYRDGFGGVRVEGDYLITDTGYERLDLIDEELGA